MVEFYLLIKKYIVFGIRGTVGLCSSRWTFWFARGRAGFYLFLAALVRFVTGWSPR